MPAPKGNDNSKKLKDKKTKDKVYKSYCDHIATGKSHRSWHYEDDGLTLGWETMEKYIREDVDLDPLHKTIAVSKSFKI